MGVPFDNRISTVRCVAPSSVVRPRKHAGFTPRKKGVTKLHI